MTGSGPEEHGSKWVFFMMLLLVVAGTANFIVFKLMYSAYGANNSFFVNQGTVVPPWY